MHCIEVYHPLHRRTFIPDKSLIVVRWGMSGLKPSLETIVLFSVMFLLCRLVDFLFMCKKC